MTFPDDHPIAVLRGVRKPTKARTLLMLRRRAGWLTRAIERDAMSYPNGDMRVGELAMTISAIELLEHDEAPTP